MSRNSYRKTGCLGAIVIAAVVVVILVIASLLTTRVPAGYVAVQYSLNGGIKDEVLSQGWHIVSPTTKTTLYSIALEQSYLTSTSDGDSKDDESFSASSSEGKALQIDLTFTYQYKSENVIKVFNQFKGQSGKEVRDGFVKPNIISWSKEVIAKYKVADILGEKRASINGDLTEYLSNKFASYGITISNVSLINIDVDKDTQKVISEKIEAQQKADTQAIKNQTKIDKAEAEKKVAITEAEAKAEEKRIKAQANADAIKIEAEAEAEANKKLRESLNDTIINKMWIDKWNGKLPTYGNMDGASVILNTGK